MYIKIYCKLLAIDHIASRVVHQQPCVVSYNIQDKSIKLSDLLPYEYNNVLSIFAGRDPQVSEYTNSLYDIIITMYIYFIIQELSAGLVSGIERSTEATSDSDNHTGICKTSYHGNILVIVFTH